MNKECHFNKSDFLSFFPLQYIKLICQSIVNYSAYIHGIPNKPLDLSYLGYDI